MLKKFFVLLLLAAPVLLHAQKKDKKVEKIAQTITAADMKKHLYTIASKEMEGRDTPSPGLEKAADYIENHFRSLGLQPGNKGSYRQYYPIYKDSMLSADLKINGNSYEINKDFQPSPSNYSAEMRFSEFVFVQHILMAKRKKHLLEACLRCQQSLHTFNLS